VQVLLKKHYLHSTHFKKSKGGAKKPAVKAPTLDLADEALSAFTQMKKPASKKSAGTIVIPTAEPTTTEPPKETS